MTDYFGRESVDQKTIDKDAVVLNACPDSDPLGIREGNEECDPSFAEGVDPNDPLSLYESKTPDNMVSNVGTLAEAAAMLSICFESDRYQSVGTDDALKLHELDSELSDIAQRIADHYDDENLFIVYELTRVEVSDDGRFREYAQKTYQTCGDKLLEEMEVYVSEADLQFPAENRPEP